MSTAQLSSLTSSALLSVQAALLRDILDEWSAKLGVNGSSRVAVSDMKTADTLVRWTQDAHKDLPWCINVSAKASAESELNPKLQKQANISTVSKIQDDYFTHVFSHINANRANETLKVLKNAYYALIPKGIAVITCSKDNRLQDIFATVVKENGQIETPQEAGKAFTETELRNLSEDAQFERGKTRWLDRRLVIKGEELQKLRADLKTGLQDALGPCEDGQGWKGTFESVFEKEVEQHGGLVVKAWVMVAMRWDLLSA